MKARHAVLIASFALLSTMNTGCVSLFAETPNGLRLGLALGNQNNGPRQPQQPRTPQAPPPPNAAGAQPAPQPPPSGFAAPIPPRV